MSGTRYTKDHEWIRLDGDNAAIGISDYAQNQLGDVVFVELPEVGKALAKGDAFAVVESVKAASDIYAPIAGDVVEINEGLADDPAKVNASPETDGWFIKLRVENPGELDELMDEAAYQAFLETIE